LDNLCPYLEHALGPVSIGIQMRIKQALDPLNILTLEKSSRINPPESVI